MVQDTSYFDEIVSAMSQERLARYGSILNSAIPHVGFVILPYITIQHASALLFPSLQIIEVCLRNKINTSIIEYFSEKPNNGHDPALWYIWLIKEEKTKKKIDKAIDKATSEVSGRPVCQGDIISRINFSIWLSIIQEIKRDRYLWSEVSQKVFSGQTRNGDKLPSTRDMIDTLKNIKTIRNRFSHHEPIWINRKIKNLNDAEQHMKDIHEEILECLSWMSACLYDVYTSGGAQYDKTFTNSLNISFNSCRAMSKITDDICNNVIIK